MPIWSDFGSWMNSYQFPTLSFGEPTSPAPISSAIQSLSVVEPPPAGYPRVIVHPERPNAAFALIENGWYRSPTGEVVSYKTVADYVLSAQGATREQLLKVLGQLPGGGGFPFVTIAIALGVGLLLVKR